MKGLCQLVSKNAVVWLRGVDDETLKKLYVSSRFVVMASHAEGYGLPIAEGMAAGVPVIAGNNTAMPEVLGSCGLLVNTNDVDDIMCAYKNLIEDHELCLRLGQAGAIRARGLSWDKSAIRYSEILDELQSTTQ